MLLDRDTFRTKVFERDKHKCVACGQPAKDAHHLIERRLFPDGGYYLNNGVSLCSGCHLLAEQTELSVEDLRKKAGITEIVLPPQLYKDQPYDKWGNPILPNNTRLRGELFDDPSVQKILGEGNVLSKFSKYVKYPRTWHLPWSPGITDDDRVIPSCDCFAGKKVVVTVKMDGENTSMYNDYIHARSLADKKHWSKSWVKNFHAKIANQISDDMRLIVENMYAKHSIKYTLLQSYVYGISIWQGLTCLSWADTEVLFDVLDIPRVPVLYEGIWDEDKIRRFKQPEKENQPGDEMEGYVVRIVDSFHYKDFRRSVAKYVRKNHVKTDDHWFYGKAGEKNELKA